MKPTARPTCSCAKCGPGDWRRGRLPCTGWAERRGPGLVAAPQSYRAVFRRHGQALTFPRTARIPIYNWFSREPVSTPDRPGAGPLSTCPRRSRPRLWDFPLAATAPSPDRGGSQQPAPPPCVSAGPFPGWRSIWFYRSDQNWHHPIARDIHPRPTAENTKRGAWCPAPFEARVLLPSPVRPALRAFWQITSD